MTLIDWIDLWFPLMNSGGMVAASDYAVLNVEKNGKMIEIKLSALQRLEHPLIVRSQGMDLLRKHISLNPLELDVETFKIEVDQHFEVILGENLLFYSSDPEDLIVDRPLQKTPNFNWNSTYGNYVRGLEFEKQRQYVKAHEHYQKSLLDDPEFVPSLDRIALSHFRRMEFDLAKVAVSKALSIDTYDPMANFIFGLLNERLGKAANAKVDSVLHHWIRLTEQQVLQPLPG